MAHECPHGIPAFGFRACYWHLKIRALRHEDLTEEELDFIGMRPNGHKPAGGWREPNALTHLNELNDQGELSAEDSAMLSALHESPPSRPARVRQRRLVLASDLRKCRRAVLTSYAL